MAGKHRWVDRRPADQVAIPVQCRPGIVDVRDRMTGRHSAGRPVWQVIAERRLSDVSVRQTPAPVAPLVIDMTDGHTLVSHSVSDALLTQGRPVGRYRAICGARLLSVSPAQRERERCPTCARWTS